MNGTLTKVSDEIKVMYININRIISRKLELVDYLKVNMCVSRSVLT